MKTTLHAEEGKRELVITRGFNLPVELLFKAYVDPEIVEQWIGMKVLKLESKKHGGYQLEALDPKGNEAHRANGAIHAVVPNQKIIRTLEIENSPYDVQLEFLDFEKITEETSKLTIARLYRSAAHRDQMLKDSDFASIMNVAHDKLQAIANTLK